MVYAAQPPATLKVEPRLLAFFFGGYVLLIAAMRLWAIRLTRRISVHSLSPSLRRFGFGMLIARLLVAKWYIIGLYLLSWGDLVLLRLTPVQWQVALPGTIIGTLPAFIAWMALWWANFPADRALREQNLLYQLEADLPVHAPPQFWRYLLAQLRLQMLFTIVPVLLILAIRDVAVLALRAMGHTPRQGSDSEEFVLLRAAIIV